MDSNKNYDYDIFVIGGGSGGLRTAKTAKMLGAKVALADYVTPSPQGNTWGLGGTCVNVGCIPKKLFHYSSLCRDYIKDSIKSGWNIKEGPHNYKELSTSVMKYIKSLNWDSKKSLLENEIKYFNFYAKILNNHEIEVNNMKGNIRKVTAKYIVVSTGGRPNYPPNIKNLKELSITSDDVFFLEELPKRVLIVGAGYIALECGGFLKGFGSQVDICVRSQVLRGFDRESIDKLQKFMSKDINFLMGILPESLEKLENNQIKVILKNLQTGEVREEIYDKVLCATGRDPELLNIGLENLKGIEFNGKKLKRNDKYEISEEKNVFALGDVVSNSLELTPIALREGEILAQRLFTKEQTIRSINYDFIPTTVFTPLEYSFCGLTEEKAIELYGEENISVFTSQFKPLEWAFEDKFSENICYSKLITLIPKEKVNEINELKNKSEPNSYLNRLLNYNNKIIGIHYLGPHAGEVMQGYGVAILKGITYGEFTETIGIHPTSSENIVNLKFMKSNGEVQEGCWG